MDYIPYIITNKPREDNISAGSNGILTQIRLEDLCKIHGIVFVVDDWGNVVYLMSDREDHSHDRERPLNYNMPEFIDKTKERWKNGCRPEIAVVYSYYNSNFERLSRECGREPVRLDELKPL